MRSEAQSSNTESEFDEKYLGLTYSNVVYSS